MFFPPKNTKHDPVLNDRQMGGGGVVGGWRDEQEEGEETTRKGKGRNTPQKHVQLVESKRGSCTVWEDGKAAFPLLFSRVEYTKLRKPTPLFLMF